MPLPQPTSGPAGPSGDEGLEDPVAHFVRDPRSVVPDLQPDRIGHDAPGGQVAHVGRAGDGENFDFAVAGLHGVQQQVGDHPVEQILVAVHHGPATPHVDLGILTGIGMLPDQPRRRQYHGVKVDRVEPGDPDPGEIEELAQQPAQPVALPDDETGEEPLVVIGPGRAGKLLDRASDRRQRVPDFVGQ
jgi:hypothetical protein